MITCGNYLDKFTDLSSNSHQEEVNNNYCFLGVAGPHESQNHITKFFSQNVGSGILMESEDGVVIIQALKLRLWVRKVVIYCYRL